MEFIKEYDKYDDAAEQGLPSACPSSGLPCFDSQQSSPSANFGSCPNEELGLTLLKQINILYDMHAQE